MEKQDMRVLTLDPYQHGVVINALNNLRNDLIEDKRPTDKMPRHIQSLCRALLCG